MTKKRRQPQQISLSDRQRQALIALNKWEFYAALTISEEALLKRYEFLEKAWRLLKHEPNSIEFLTKDAQLCALKDAIEARGITL